MPFFKNVSGAVQVRPGDGVTAFFEVAPGETVEADSNPAPAAFDETTAPKTARQSAAEKE